MVEIDTRVFGKIAIEEEKIIRFEDGILGFPDLRDFTLIYDIDKGSDANIKWLQSLDEPGFALPVMNPDLVVSGYAPRFDRSLIESLGDNLRSDDILIFVTVTIPKNDVTRTTVNLKAPIIINVENRKAVQIIAEGGEYKVRYGIYDVLQARKKAGE